MADLSRARLFFDEVLGKKDQAFAFLAALINGGEAAAENGWRDYKEAGFLGKTGNPGKEKETIKRLWSENLSAFANTSGGVVIWGFHTKGKIPDKLSLAPDCEQLADWLRDLIKDATDPYVAGVEVLTIRKPGSTAPLGFVVCHVPASKFVPHQALWGERTYFIRAQDSNTVCPQPLLRNMFFPRSLAWLEPDIRMTAQLESGNILVHLETRIRSRGPATAEVAILQVEPRDLGNPHVGFDHHWEVMAPNVVKYKYPLPPNFKPPHLITIRGVLVSGGASIVYRFFTHNTPAHHATVTFSRDEVLACVNNTTCLDRSGQSEPINP